MRITTRLAAIGSAAALLASLGCGSDADKADEGDEKVETGESEGFEATPGYLSQIVDEAEDTSYRFSMTMEMDFEGETLEFDAPIATGEYDGNRQSLVMDMGVMFKGLAEQFGQTGESLFPPELTSGDMTIQYIVDGQDLYIRAPFYATLFGSLPSGTDVGGAADVIDAFGQLGEKWGHVDLSKLGNVEAGDVASRLGGGQVYDPAMFLDMIRESASVEELGTEEIDGVEVSGLAAEISMSDMLAAQGLTAEDLGPEAAQLPDMTFPLEVWVDGDDHVRRIVLDFGEETLSEALEESGGDAEEIDALGGFGVRTTMDFTDFGDEAITVEVPSPDNVVEITSSFIAGYDALGDLSAETGDLGGG